MRGIGTIVNVIAIIAGALLGMIFGKKLKESLRETLLKGIGFSIIVMALAGSLSKMLIVENGVLTTQGTMMMILSIAFGAVLGEWIDIDGKFTRFGEYLKVKTRSENDSNFIEAFVSASLTVCIGAMAILGAISDGLYQDPTILYAKSVLDLIIIMVMSASLGKGCLFSCIPVALFQGAITLLAHWIEPVMTLEASSNLSLVGNVLILCVGVNLIWPNTIRVANLLPAVLIAVIFAWLPFI